MADSDRNLTRDVEATIIPAGDKATLPKDTPVTITHKLGGNFTITCGYGMFRINGKDADALGEELPEEAKPSQPSNNNYSGPPNEEAIWDKIKTVYDPEIPVNIVDLGLVYSLDISEDNNTFSVTMSMTLTAPGCGMGPAIAEDAKNRILEVPGVHNADVKLVWDPPWTQDMISEVGKMELGLV